jgi:tetratricopeptide (TPR) repeat protein
VEGRILADNGQPLSERVSVKLSCGTRTVQVIRTDLKGYFQFALGAGVQSNLDFSAADEAPMPSILTGINVPGGYSGFGTSGGSLTGCDLRISVPGYQPLISTITDPASLGTIEIGTLELRRIGGMPGAAISATSLLAPSNARKEFDLGVKDMRSNNLKSATQHLERAVAQYDTYAAAWTELGKLYSANRETEKSHQAFEKAISSDPRYAPPYVSLAALKLQAREYQSAIEAVDKALELDPSLSMGVASYIRAVGNFNLNRLDAAEKSALEAEKGPHQNTPQLHAMLADIYLRKQDSSKAAAEIRAYLKEAPRGPLVAELKKHLERIEKSASNTGSTSNSPAQPQTAP